MCIRDRFSVSPYKWLRWTAEIFVDVIRGIPLMILAAFIFWGIPNLIESVTGHQSPINDFVAGTIALSLNAAAYIAEIVRGGIQAVPIGQMEACLLYTSAKNENRIFSIEELYNYLYPVDSDAQLRSITEYIYQIRQKFKIHQIDPIKTVWGGGYKWKKN